MEEQANRSTSVFKGPRLLRHLLNPLCGMGFQGKFAAAIKLYFLQDESGTRRRLRGCLTHFRC